MRKMTDLERKDAEIAALKRQLVELKEAQMLATRYTLEAVKASRQSAAAWETAQRVLAGVERKEG